MTTRTRAIPVVLALAAALAACGSADPSGSKPSGSAPGGTVSMTPPNDFAAARQVTVLRTGGIRPTRVTTVFAANRPAPQGFSKAEVTAVLRAAADPRLESAPSGPPTVPCCDLYTYRVTVTYPDATSLTFSITDGVDAPAAQERLLRLVS